MIEKALVLIEGELQENEVDKDECRKSKMRQEIRFEFLLERREFLNKVKDVLLMAQREAERDTTGVTLQSVIDSNSVVDKGF